MQNQDIQVLIDVLKACLEDLGIRLEKVDYKCFNSINVITITKEHNHQSD